MRLIDADELMAKWEELRNRLTDGSRAADIIGAMINDVYSVPSIDIIRCKECIYPKERDGFYRCNYSAIWRNADDSCSYGERRE